MIESLVPPWVAVEEAFRPDPVPELFPEEQEIVADSVERRRQEFATVRGCARRALGRLDVGPVPILTGTDGAPVWPGGTVGSMTHCAGYCAAAVARTAEVASLGIDAEPGLPLPPGVLESVALPGERIRLAGLADRQPDIFWDRLLFSAKESVYKAWYPLTGRWLDFHEADIAIDPRTRTFRAGLLVPGPVVEGRRIEAFSGNWRVGNGLVVTAITVPRC
ncbi:4'-phosphopantetheinyl transferase [Streptomyces sp. NPDC019443]|uniref:4'-phosphopantetheinyl transferase n=1 Tax=Streptomyces sp. NPDC019443 TaxID=3365061 RepID=UPI0037914CB5